MGRKQGSEDRNPPCSRGTNLTKRSKRLSPANFNQTDAECGSGRKLSFDKLKRVCHGMESTDSALSQMNFTLPHYCPKNEMSLLKKEGNSLKNIGQI